MLLEETFGEDYQPTKHEILEYAVYLGINEIKFIRNVSKKRSKIFYIAEEGLTTPIPHPC